MILTIDFETRSACDLRKSGAYRYAQDPSTDVMCLAFKPDDEPTRLWIPEWAQEVFGKADDRFLLGYHLDEADEIHAHNAQFERAIWRHVMSRYGFEDIPLEKWRCTAAKAAAMGLPRDLARACRASGVQQQKDTTGYKVMMKMCKPRKPRKAERDANPDWENTLYWWEAYGDYQTLLDYCEQDVEAEHALDLALPDLRPTEQALWFLDQRINDRGLYLDLESIDAMIQATEQLDRDLCEEVAGISHAVLNSARQQKAMLLYLATRGCHMADLQKQTVETKLERKDLDPRARRLLEIRQLSARSSVKKLQSMAVTAGSDSRVRGSLLYWGAIRTGRWAGKLVQPHNLPRGTLKPGEVEEALWCFRNFGHEFFKDPMATASSCLRGLITAGPGHDLLAADFANIEGRCAAWLAGEDWKTQAFREYDLGTGPDLYCLAYSKAFGIPLEKISKDQRFIGKVMELSLQYQGWVGAFATMAANYGVSLPEDEVANICGLWRRAHPRIVTFWGVMAEAAIRAVETGRQFSAGKIKFGVRGQYLHMKLPSGRLLSYNKPRVVEREDLYKRTKKSVEYMGMNTMINKWMRLHTYGGKLFENAIQAIARDVMAEAMLRVEAAGFPIVLTVHDEILAEVPHDEGSQMKFQKLMTVLPEWVSGLPVAVAGWRGQRYRKD